MFEKAERDLPRSVIRRATAVLVLLYLISFVTPALCFDRAVSDCERSIPGYLAALGSLAVVGEWFNHRIGETSVLDIIESLPIATAWLVNLPFLALAPWLLVSPRPRPFRRARWLAGAAAIDAVLLPVMVTHGQGLDTMLVGYWLWASTLSLFAVGIFVLSRTALLPQPDAVRVRR